MTLTVHLSCGCRMSGPARPGLIEAAMREPVGGEWNAPHRCANPDPPRPVRLVAVQVSAPLVPCPTFTITATDNTGRPAVEA